MEAALLDDLKFSLGYIIIFLFMFSCAGLVFAKFQESTKWIKIFEIIIAIYTTLIFIGLLYLFFI